MRHCNTSSGNFRECSCDCSCDCSCTSEGRRLIFVKYCNPYDDAFFFSIGSLWTSKSTFNCEFQLRALRLGTVVSSVVLADCGVSGGGDRTWQPCSQDPRRENPGNLFVIFFNDIRQSLLLSLIVQAIKPILQCISHVRYFKHFTFTYLSPWVY